MKIAFVSSSGILLCAWLLWSPPSAFSKPDAGEARPAALGKATVVNSYHPIVISGFNDFSLIGGAKDGKWWEPDPPSKPLAFIRGGERYTLYSLAGRLGTGLGGKVRSGMEAGGRGPYFKVKIKPDQKEARRWRLAIHGDWDAMPRKLKVQKPGISYLVDLDGDGQDESILLRRKTTRVQDEMTGEWQTNERVDLVVRTKGKAAAITCSFHGQCEFGTFDLNGDGRLEIVVFDQRSPSPVVVHELRREWTTVLSVTLPGD